MSAVDDALAACEPDWNSCEVDCFAPLLRHAYQQQEEIAQLKADVAELVAVLTKAYETLGLGRGFAGQNKEEFDYWCGHAEMVETEAYAIVAKHTGAKP